MGRGHSKVVLIMDLPGRDCRPPFPVGKVGRWNCDDDTVQQEAGMVMSCSMDDFHDCVCLG